MNNNENQNNYVIPDKVDLTKVNVDQTNAGALNRERDNIISATIQANNAINEKDAKVVNNTIKVKKRNPFVLALVAILACLIAGGGAFLVVHLMQKYIKYQDDLTTTTIKTTVKVNHVANYINNASKARKFQSDNTLLILVPNSSSYIYLKLGKEAIQSQEVGIYTLENDHITLSNGIVYSIEEDGLKSDELLKMNDAEMKYYSDDAGNILLVNATFYNEIAYYNGSLYNYTESQENIVLNDQLVFTKNGMSLNIEDKVLNLGQ